jgi:hypothetical protein
MKNCVQFWLSLLRKTMINWIGLNKNYPSIQGTQSHVTQWLVREIGDIWFGYWIGIAIFHMLFCKRQKIYMIWRETRVSHMLFCREIKIVLNNIKEQAWKMFGEVSKLIWFSIRTIFSWDSSNMGFKPVRVVKFLSLSWSSIT